MAERPSGQDLDAWLVPFLAAMGRKTRRTWAPLYLRGLLGPGDRKSLQPMAARLGLPGHDQLQHFIASPAWDDGPLWAELTRTADRLVGGSDACLVIDDTALPKKGTRSVGVARQYCGHLGKKANCQSLVSLTLARGEVPVPVCLHLFLPEEWVANPKRCQRAGVPEAAVVPQSKGEIALAELDRLQAEGVRFGVVLADAGYGCSAVFRHGLDARGLTWAVGIAKNQKVYDPDVRLVEPGGRARRPVPDQEPQEAEAVLAALPWRRVAWRQGTKGALAARFAMTRVRVGDGPIWGNNRHLRAPRSGWWASGAPRASASTTSRTCRPARPGAPGRHNQGALGVRAGPPAVEGGTGPRPLRGPLLDWPAPARADDVHRLRLPAAPAPGWARPDGWGKKRWLAYRDRHRLRACPPCGRPSSAACSSASSHRCDARTVAAASGCRLTSKCPGSVRGCYGMQRSRRPCGGAGR